MRSGSSLSRRAALLIVIISPALLGSQFKCVVVSNPAGAVARIDQIEPVMPRVGETVRATGSGTGTAPLQFVWDFGDGTSAPGTQAAHIYTAPGTYRLTLTVRDSLGNVGLDAAQVMVSSRLSSSLLSLVLASDAVAGQPVVFAAFPAEENASALNYVWTFSGGQSAIGPRAVAMFPVPGTYLASVTVTDDIGAMTVAEIAFQVGDAAQ